MRADSVSAVILSHLGRAHLIVIKRQQMNDIATHTAFTAVPSRTMISAAFIIEIGIMIAKAAESPFFPINSRMHKHIDSVARQTHNATLDKSFNRYPHKDAAKVPIGYKAVKIMSKKLRVRRIIFIASFFHSFPSSFA